MEKLKVYNEVLINSSKEIVWDWLTNPAKTKVYMFGCETVTDWKPGTELIWRANYEGKDMDFVKGFVIDIIPGEKLKYSVIDPNAPYPQTPENHLMVTYELKESAGQVLLSVTQDGFETVADGEKRYEEVYNKGEGWGPILTEIKKLAEA